MVIKSVVIALGGNALIKPGEKGTVTQQLQNLQSTANQIAKMVEEGHEIILSHGNGPQVGALLIQQEEAESEVPALPLDVCVADSQGEIGYLLQQTLSEELDKRGVKKDVFTIITQVKVDENDPAFQNPTKPVGPFYTEKEAKRLSEQKDWNIKKTSGDKYRRVVPSPDPKQIIEEKPIARAAEENIVIACGGGGIPVIETEKGLEGIEAVIDKDLASERLAQAFGAELLIILTDVDKVFLDYGTEQQKPVNKMTTEEAKEYMEQDQFTEGSMKPKIKAAIRFVKSGGEACMITSLGKAEKALKGQAGTVITD